MIQNIENQLESNASIGFNTSIYYSYQFWCERAFRVQYV